MNDFETEPLSISNNVMLPVFIGGTGRSGTTILKRIMTCHSMIISFRDELGIIINPDGILDLVNALSDQWSPYNADIAIHRFRDLMLTTGGAKYNATIYLGKAIKVIFRKLGISPPRYTGAGLSYYFGPTYYRKCLEQLLSNLCYHTTRGSWAGSPPLKIKSRIYESGPFQRKDLTRIAANFINDLYKNVANNGESYWLDDTPYNILHATELMELFPKMHLIHIFRDPRDVLSSYRGFSWGGDNYLSIARRLAGIYQYWDDIRKKIPKELYIEIGLEGLAENPEVTLREICNFLNIDFEDRLLKISLDKVHSGRWKHDLARENIYEIEKILKPFIVAYGYTL